MKKYSVMTPEIEDIDKAITALKTRREKLVAKEANKKAQELCAEIRKRKSK